MLSQMRSDPPHRIYIEIHTAEEITAEVEHMRQQPKLMNGLFINGTLRRWCLEEDLRTEAYNRLTLKTLLMNRNEATTISRRIRIAFRWDDWRLAYYPPHPDCVDPERWALHVGPVKLTCR
jgi:hypothetical protein